MHGTRQEHRAKRRGVMVALAVVATVLASAPSGAAAPAEEHCVVRVVDQRPDGELVTTRPDCSPTRVRALAGEWVIGSHYDGQNLTGSSFNVVGADCVGGWLNLPAVWINRVSSTLHGCGHIRHFDGYNLVSPNQMTVYPGGNLSPTMNNRTNSIQYLP